MLPATPSSLFPIPLYPPCRSVCYSIKFHVNEYPNLSTQHCRCCYLVYPQYYSFCCVEICFSQYLNPESAPNIANATPSSLFPTPFYPQHRSVCSSIEFALGECLNLPPSIAKATHSSQAFVTHTRTYHLDVANAAPYLISHAFHLLHRLVTPPPSSSLTDASPYLIPSTVPSAAPICVTVMVIALNKQ